ncbi:MAG: Cthe_2314 family HEPN domain-containing protein [Staphylococcus aureus]|nr:Cthe_2314 family HEPN domain-containing protein [Staphylococcus aureus]
MVYTYCKVLVHRDNINDMYELTDNYNAKKYWFEYNAQYAIRLISTLNDYLYRYINLVNQFEIKPKTTFKNDVVKKLKEYKKRSVVVALRKNSDLLDKYRNDITHNYNVFINGALKVTKKIQNL